MRAHDKELIEDIHKIYEWLYLPARKIQDLIKPGQKINTY